MTHRPLLPLLAAATLCLVASAALAQHGRPARPPASPPPEAAQYNFLLGEWDLEVSVPAASLAAKIHGMPKLVGTWKAWRGLDGWGISDELRLTDEAGNPMSLTHNVRFYDPRAKHWVVSTLDVYRGTLSTPTAQWREDGMHLVSRGTGPDGRPYRSRTRIYEIEPTSFSLQQDRSFDDGKTWEEGALRIEARRTAAAAQR